MQKIDFAPIEVKADEEIFVDFDTPFVHTDPFQGIYLYGGFNDERQVIKDYKDSAGRRCVRFRLLSSGLVREIKLQGKVKTSKLKVWHWN